MHRANTCRKTAVRSGAPLAVRFIYAAAPPSVQPAPAPGKRLAFSKKEQRRGAQKEPVFGAWKASAAKGGREEAQGQPEPRFYFKLTHILAFVGILIKYGYSAPQISK